MLDAIRAAKEALAAEHLIQPPDPRQREALRVLLASRQSAVLASTAAINQLKALIVSAPRGRTPYGTKGSSPGCGFAAVLNCWLDLEAGVSSARPSSRWTEEFSRDRAAQLTSGAAPRLLLCTAADQQVLAADLGAGQGHAPDRGPVRRR
ncbi:hypothetical protein ACFVT5_14320 [Streptomyces sp. NPDC058001]|uniref:hypothetical protein n=1 Tax=Streptomyces sp. NPDC058001 TaxID=3346300 RepID=UPI0036E45430